MRWALTLVSCRANAVEMWRQRYDSLASSAGSDAPEYHDVWDDFAANGRDSDLEQAPLTTRHQPPSLGLSLQHCLKMICNDFLVVKVNCWSYVFKIMKYM